MYRYGSICAIYVNYHSTAVFSSFYKTSQEQEQEQEQQQQQQQQQQLLNL